jgi:ribosomal protein L37AE/L43A
MPCYRCATRQTDPGKGPSDWKRGVVNGVQVLVCPSCQRAHDWIADLDRCAACGSTMLARALGETRCRSCGVAVAGSGGDAPATDETLAADVSAALERRFGSYPDPTVP